MQKAEEQFLNSMKKNLKNFEFEFERSIRAEFIIGAVRRGVKVGVDASIIAALLDISVTQVTQIREFVKSDMPDIDIYNFVFR